jgi:hypothetical protein
MPVLLELTVRYAGVAG